jgi:hypothetical protein
MTSSGMLSRVALVRIDISKEHSASMIRVTRIGELGTTLAVTSNRRTLRRNTCRPLGLLQRVACKNWRLGGTYRLLHQGDRNR